MLVNNYFYKFYENIDDVITDGVKTFLRECSQINEYLNIDLAVLK